MTAFRQPGRIGPEGPQFFILDQYRSAGNPAIGPTSSRQTAPLDTLQPAIRRGKPSLCLAAHALIDAAKLIGPAERRVAFVQGPLIFMGIGQGVIDPRHTAHQKSSIGRFYPLQQHFQRARPGPAAGNSCRRRTGIRGPLK